MNTRFNQPISSSLVSHVPQGNILHRIGDVTWRILGIAIGYALVSLIAGPLLGRGFGWGAFGLNLLAGILIGVILGLTSAKIQEPLFRQFGVLAFVLFFNALSLGIEGAYYAPTLSPMTSQPVAWTVFLLFQSLVTAVLVAWLFAPKTPSTTSAPRKRPAYSWAWRYILSSFSYLLFYFIFGAANYALVTRPYYEAHASGLTVPSAQVVLMAELVRAPLIVLSILPLILIWRAKKPMLAFLAGMLLFVIGGVAPLLLNTALPDFLRFASAIEIFFQNFLTGVVAAALLGFKPDAGAETH